MTQAERWMALWRFEWSRGRGIRSSWKRRLVWILVAAGVSLAAGLILSASTSASPDRVGVASLSVWLFLGSFSLASWAGGGDGLGATAMLPYSRSTVVCVRAAAAYVRLMGWLLLGAALSAGVHAAHGLLRNPQVLGTWLSLLAVAVLAYAGLACVSAVFAALRSSPYRWLGTVGDAMWTGLMIFIVDDIAKRGPLSGTHESWLVFAAAYAAYGLICAAVGVRCLARGSWLHAAWRDAAPGRAEGGRRAPRFSRPPDHDALARGLEPHVANTGAEVVRTTLAIFRMAIGRALWPTGARSVWRAVAVHLTIPIVAALVFVMLQWTSPHPHLSFARLEDGMLGGAWLWSMFCGFAVTALFDHLGDWARGWPVRREGVIVGFALAENLTTWFWLTAGALGGLVLWAHAAMERAARGADLREMLIAWAVAGLCGTWNTVWSASVTLRRNRGGMSAWFGLEVFLAGVWFIEGGRMVAWVDSASWPKVAGVFVASLVLAAATLALHLRAAARELVSPER
ncbi:hypothetical protein [Alicyclobacillus sendaiensis]|uniref:hypothetical protein n=1 Tax=Alicyclobacillus sendaiensis TaxID=192387 RepID=UPI0026F42923|nr:hypothetical protein [Alicyclobacillus sendaiensis]